MTNDKEKLDKYISDYADTPLLTTEEEKMLSDRIHKGDRKAIDELVAHNLRFVVTVARQYVGRGLDMDDLVAEGNVGLLQAAEKFDASHGKRFVKFAAPFIRDSIRKSIDSQTGLFSVPALDRTPSSARRRKALSVDAPVGGSSELSLLHVLADPHSPQADEGVSREILADDIKSSLGVLNDRERKVVELFYGLGHDNLTFAEIAEVMGLKRERVRQIRNRAVRRMCRQGRLRNALNSYFRNA